MIDSRLLKNIEKIGINIKIREYLNEIDSLILKTAKDRKDIFMDHYDVVTIGSGISNIMAVLNLVEKNPTLNILMIEKGNELSNRRCPKDLIGHCVNCDNCYLFGWGGAGTFSDSKLTYSPDVGGTIIDYIGEDNFNSYINQVDDIFTYFGGNTIVNYNEDFANKVSYECSKFGLRLIKGKVRHLGTDGSQKVMQNIYNHLKVFKNITMLCNTEVIDIDFKNKKVIFQNKQIKPIVDTIVSADNILIGVGRSGSDWLTDLCKKKNINLLNTFIDIGVRVECPAAITDNITKELYEFKIVNYSDTSNKVRTFCINPHGYVTQETYDDGIVCVNGHSYLDKHSENTNFALLVSCKFTEPFNEPIKFGKTLCSYINMLTNGKVMVQRLVDLKNKKRSTKERMKRLSITPTLKDAEPGDLRYALPSNVLDSIIQTLDNISNVIPNLNGPNTILYAPEVKFYSSLIDVNNQLQVEEYPDIYWLGDSSGITHGIIQSSISGLYSSDLILKK